MSQFTIMDGIFIMTLGGIGMVMPTPSGIGSYHMAAMIGLGMISADFTMNLSEAHSDQLSFAFLVHTAQTVMILVMVALLQRLKLECHLQQKFVNLQL